jgi:biotin operon repressor
MTNLFYPLLTNPKIKRWLLMLDQLEEQSLTGKELSKVLGCTRRTIISDIKQIKSSFQSTLFLLGDENGYLLELQDPVNYYQKKQALLETERMFQMIDALFENQSKPNQEWAPQLALPSATFTRLKRQLGMILREKYGLRLASTTNQVLGAETRIRQFFFDFYFTLPLYPQALTAKINQMRTTEIPNLATKWQLKQVQFQGWLVVTTRRIEQGYFLQQDQDPQICQELARALDPTGRLNFPEREKATLFLAALDETQFIRPVIQTEFIYLFSTTSWETLLEIEEEQKYVLLFQILLQLKQNFFHLPFELERKKRATHAGQEVEAKLVEQLISRFLKEKEQVEQSIFVTFRLVGSQALQKWIKEELRFQLNEEGYQLYEEDIVFNGWSLPRMQVTNNPNSRPRPTEIHLSVVPTREEIADKVKQYQVQ